MQEVQSQWETYQENHEIEQIGYSSRKVSDKTQVRDKKSFGIVFSETSMWVLWEDEQSEYNQMGFSGSISEEFGDTEFKVTGGDIRIPLYGGYRLVGYMYGGSGSVGVGFDFMVNGQSIKKFQTNSPSVHVPFDFTINLGKYDVLTVRVKINDSVYDPISGTAYMQLAITKL